MSRDRVLLINTCGAEGIAAVADGVRVVGEERLPGRGASESLVPAVKRLLEGFAWEVKDLTAVGVVVGPGSFTGVRVGLSTAKGLCEARGLRMVAMSRLALVAGADGVGVLDAGRGEYYCGVYEAGSTIAEELVRGDEVRRWLDRGIAVTCEERVATALGRIGPRVRLSAEPGSSQMLAMVLRRIAAAEWSDVARTNANYLRRTDAELVVKGTRVR